MYFNRGCLKVKCAVMAMNACTGYRIIKSWLSLNNNIVLLK